MLYKGGKEIVQSFPPFCLIFYLGYIDDDSVKFCMRFHALVVYLTIPWLVIVDMTFNEMGHVPFEILKNGIPQFIVGYGFCI